MPRSRQKKSARPASSRQNVSQLRIIGGIWRSRRFDFEAAEGLRPTPNRVRETLFNWLSNEIHGAKVLDMFSGSGALGFEAASRGACSVLLCEQHGPTANHLRQVCEQLAAKQVNVYQGDAFMVSQVTGTFDIIFVDPPFNMGFAAKSLNHILSQQLLNDDGLVYLEVEKGLDLKLEDQWAILKDKTAGDVRYLLLSKHQNDSA